MPLAVGVPAGADDHQADALLTQVLLKHFGDATEDVVVDRRYEVSDQEALVVRKPRAAVLALKSRSETASNTRALVSLAT